MALLLSLTGLLVSGNCVRLAKNAEMLYCCNMGILLAKVSEVNLTALL